MTATSPGDGWYDPDSCPTKDCRAAPGKPHEDSCPVPLWEREATESVARGLAALTGCDADEWPIFEDEAARIVADDQPEGEK